MIITNSANVLHEGYKCGRLIQSAIGLLITKTGKLIQANTGDMSLYHTLIVYDQNSVKCNGSAAKIIVNSYITQTNRNMELDVKEILFHEPFVYF